MNRCVVCVFAGVQVVPGLQSGQQDSCRSGRPRFAGRGRGKCAFSLRDKGRTRQVNSKRQIKAGEKQVKTKTKNVC